MRQRADKFIKPADAADALKVGVRDALHVVYQVLPNRTLEEPGVLQNHGEHIVHRLAPQLGYRRAVYLYAAAVYLEKAHQQVDHRGLARAGRADDGHLLAGADLGGEVLDDYLVRRVRIAEADVLEADRALHLGHLVGLVALVGQLLALEEVENAVRGGGRGLHVGHALRDLRQGRGEEPDVHDEGYDHAEPDRPVYREHRADDAHRDICDVADHVHQRLHQAGEELRLPVRVVHGAVHAVEALLDALSGAGDAHDLMAGVHLLDVAVQLAEALLPRREIFLRAGHDEHDQQQADQRDAERGEREAPLGHEHHDEAADELRRRADYRRQAVRQSLLQRGDVVRDAAENVALRGGVEVFLRHAVYLFRQLPAHPARHLERHCRHDIVLSKGEDRAQAVYYGEENADLRDGGHVDAGGEALGHEVRHLADLVRPHYRQHRAEGREHQRGYHQGEIAAHIRRYLFQRRAEIDLFGHCHSVMRSHYSGLLYASSAALSCERAIS